ncbi:hypothetical protein IFM89_030563, partial [Coptis chinensis]
TPLEAMNTFSNTKTKWKKKTPNKPLLSIFLFLISIFFLISYTQISKSLFPNSLNSPIPQFPQCKGEKFLWFAPHSGFSNQLSELKNAILMASILNRTLIVPPVMDHHAVVLGSCPKFRVLDPMELRMKVWGHVIELIQSHRYVSMADIVDFSPQVSSSLIKIIDFRVFVMLWCGIETDLACFDKSEVKSTLFDSLKQCGSLLSGKDGNVEGCLYAVGEDCRTTVWTYQQDSEDGMLDSFQPDEQLRKKKKVSYTRKRRDVYKALGPGSEAGSATILAFGIYFTVQRNLDTNKNKNCRVDILPDILLCVEEAVCSCGKLGFVGTSGSTIAESVELLRKNGVCLNEGNLSSEESEAGLLKVLIDQVPCKFGPELPLTSPSG